MNGTKSFEASWAFPSDIKHQLGAASYEVRPLPEYFKTGRPKIEVLFLDDSRRLISRRIGMELVSKKTGRPYHMCQREEPSRLQRAPRPASTPNSHGFTLDDVFDNDNELPPPLPLRRETTSDYYHNRVQAQ